MPGDCCCPPVDAVTCVQRRYGRSYEDAIDDPCDCACHDSDCYADDEDAPDAGGED